MTDDRDRLEIDALVTDAYLDSLLAARERRHTPAHAEDVQPAVGHAARALETQLARVHPSFRFEDRLATELQAAAVRQRRGIRAGRPAAIRRLEPRPPATTRVVATPSPGRDAQVPRPLLIGGALTSAAISIAGAYVAWRRGRPPLHPMVSAVRAARRGGIARRIPVSGSRLPLRRGARNG
jgi:hypothetical protein